MLYECLSQDLYNLFPDIFGSNALCLQTPLPRTDVYEYCTSYDECLAFKRAFFFNYETEVLRFCFILCMLHSKYSFTHLPCAVQKYVYFL